MRKSAEELFNLLDANRDGELSRTDLHQAAQRLGWHWYHASLYAVLDLLTIWAPLSVNIFLSYMDQIFRDADGPYGRVLLHSALFTDAASGGGFPGSSDPAPERETHETWGGEDILALLERNVGKEIADNYMKVLQDLEYERSRGTGCPPCQLARLLNGAFGDQEAVSF